MSLIEALVALAVMAFGMLGVVGMQASLRYNADLSRQRAEAVRLAQEQMETWRNYSVLSGAVAPQIAFEDIADTGVETLVVAAVNTTFKRETLVTPEAAGEPRLREVRVFVSWFDRRGVLQDVRLASLIGYVPAELGALMAKRADRGPVGQPGARNPSIPRGAVPVSGEPGRSSFEPPGGGGLTWIFNNDTGLIVATCPPPPATCITGNKQLVSGNIGFVLTVEPTSAKAEVPEDIMPTGMTVGMQVRQRFPTTNTEACYTGESGDRRRVTYYCAVPVLGPKEWTGTIDPLIRIAGVDVRSTDTHADTVAGDTAAPTDSSNLRYRVCRYTPNAANLRSVPTSGVAARLAYNSQHPWRYVLAAQPFADRNLLVIKAGDGAGLVFQCPTEDTATAIQSNTFHHPRVP